jgi:hypothetical protein
MGIAMKEIEKSFEKEKSTHDSSKRMAKPLSIGSKVLTRRYHFEGRHKLEDRYNPLPYVVVDKNEHDDLYLIKPADGTGDSKWTNRKSIIEDTRKLSLTESDSDDDGFDYPFDNISFEPPTMETPETDSPQQVRRSARTNKGKHSNPFKLPKSVTKI